jgi:predicted nucleic acid-binding protein
MHHPLDVLDAAKVRDDKLDKLFWRDSLVRVCDWIEVVDNALYADFETNARERMAGRDEDDWPVVAVALALDSPIWTEDRDFFGAGIATWTTDRVELYLKR